MQHFVAIPPDSLPPLLLPAPRALRLTGGTIADAGEQITVDPHLPAEGFRLVIADGIRIAHADAAGLRHAQSALAQLRAQYGAHLPCLELDDAPAFAVRGVMLDISRDRVPTMAHLRALIDQLAGFRINHLQLYTEHAFAYAGHDAVWREASPITADELRELDALCAERGIALVANQNCFGHLERWLAHPQYAPLAEIAPGAPWDFNGLVTKTGPFSLCPGDPAALALVRDLLGQLLPLLRTPLVNLGCDETYDVGQGRSRATVAERGRAAVYLDFVRQVCAIARGHGRRPLFWADIALEHPEALAELPDDLICLCWGYEADAPFARWLAQVRGREAWVCPGTSCWRSIIGRTTERRANLLAAAQAGVDGGARGYLITAWGDLGHRQQWPVTLNALAEGAHRAWSGTADYDPRAASLHAFGDRGLETAAWLDALGDADHELRRVGGREGGVLRNASALFTDLAKPLDDPWLALPMPWDFTADRLEELAQRLPAGAEPLIRAELAATVSEALLACARARWRRQRPRSATERSALAQSFRRQAALHRTLWRRRSRPGGLEASVAPLIALAEELEQA